jgi:hypothetical protein
VMKWLMGLMSAWSPGQLSRPSPFNGSRESPAGSPQFWVAFVRDGTHTGRRDLTAHEESP